MTSTIVVASLVVLVVAGLLLFNELRAVARVKRAVRKSKPPAAVATAPREVVSLLPEALSDTEDITTIGRVGVDGEALVRPAEKVRGRLVSLSNVEDTEDEGSSRSEAITLFEDRAEIDEPSNPRELFFVAAVAQSDKGLKRRRNEDSYLILEEHALFLVADGMGGYAGGDVASKLAVDAVGAAYNGDRFAIKTVDPARPVHAMQLVAAIESAHRAVLERALEQPDLAGMGTTIVGARFLKKRQRVYIAHVGDSRCYRLRNGILKQLTTDHTLAARGIPAPMGNSIRRAVGVGKRVKVDLVVDVPQPGDVYLLCSDGLNKMVSDDDIRSAMVSAIDEDIDTLARRLVAEANSAGGKDNITALVARVLNAPPQSLAP